MWNCLKWKYFFLFLQLSKYFHSIKKRHYFQKFHFERKCLSQPKVKYLQKTWVFLFGRHLIQLMSIFATPVSAKDWIFARFCFWLKFYLVRERQSFFFWKTLNFCKLIPLTDWRFANVCCIWEVKKISWPKNMHLNTLGKPSLKSRPPFIKRFKVSWH